MFNWFRNFKIRNKLIAIFLVMVLLSLIASLTALISQNYMQKKIAQRLDIENKTVELNAQTENAMLMARRAEKDYLLRYQQLGLKEARIQYADRVKGYVQDIHDYIREISKIEFHPDHIRLINTIDRSIVDYETTFMNVVDLIEKRGFEDSGIEGEFRKKVHAIEELVNKKAIESLKVDMLMMRRHEKDYLLRSDSKYINKLYESVEQLKRNIDNHTELQTVEKQELKRLAEDYQVAFDQLVKVSQQITDSIEVYRKIIHKLEPLFEEVTSEAKEHKQKAQLEAEESSEFLMTLIIVSSLFAVMINILVAIFFANWISKPLRLIVHGSQLLTAGDTKLKGIDQMALKKITIYKDEVGEIANSFNTLSNYFREVIGDLVRVSVGLAEGQLRVMPQAEYHGDFHKIKISLEKAVTNLADATTKNIEQDWLKTGQTQLNERLSGEQNIIQLSENVINFLTPYLNAQVGALYLFESSDAESGQLKMVASHAYVWRKNADHVFKLGEGIVGQAAFERKLFVVTQTPENYIQIQSGLGESKPASILVAPFLYENELKGVIELASFNMFTEIQLEFLNQAMSIIAVAVNTAESRTKMQILLEKTQAQSAELKKKTGELQSQQEELRQTNEELQSQAEELQTQQEELRQTNDQLELHSRNLEQQKEEVRLKNRALEKTQIEMKKAQSAIETKAKELELASKYKSEFLANMSHELRTPLNSLLILAQILSENRTGNLNDKQLEYAHTIHSAGSDLLNLINEILDLSKIEAGRVEVHVEPFALGDLIEAIEHKFKAIADEKGLKFNISIAPDLVGILHNDVHRLQQILNNLLSNAFKFTAKGQVTLSIFKPTKDLSKMGLNASEIIAFSVEDTGIGIPVDKQCAVFEAFQQADGTTSRKYGGTGLGLSISRQLARLLGGELVLKSEENKGSTFTIYMPEKLSIVAQNSTQKSNNPPPVANQVDVKSQTPLQDKKVEKTEESEESSDKNNDNGKATFPDDREDLKAEDKVILIIEDDRKFLNILTNLIHEKGFKIIVAEDGVIGLQLAEKYLPQAIVLDIGLPRMDGWSVMERLKDNPDTRHIPVHFMSASDQQNQDAKKMGAIGYLLKPINMGELDKAFKKIERFIAKDVKQLLVISDSEQRKQQILDLVQSKEVNVAIAENEHQLHQQLQNTTFDCTVLDIFTENNSGIKLLRQLTKEDKLSLSQVPVILYADRELTKEEEVMLQQCENNLTIKSVHSPERLLDETTLFLHQLETELPEDKRKMLNLVHNKEAIFTGKKVMIVDDDVRNTFALMSFLESKDMEVVVANNGKEAIDLLRENPDIALILMDIMMPEMDGYETMRKIKEQNQFRKLPIIALTAKAMKGDKSKCIEAGANDYVSKPVDTDKLLSLMRVWLYG